MKGFKNLKIGMKISIVVTLVLVLGLLSVMTVTISQVRNTTEVDTKNRLGEICNSRAYFVKEYIDQLCEYYAGLTTMPAVVDALKNPDNPAKITELQVTLENYVSSRDDMEGIFVTNPETLILAHTVTAAIGSQISDDPAVWADRKDGVAAAPNHVWFRGAVVSTSTGEMVGNVYAGVYDENGELLGFVGGGNYLQTMIDQVYGMDLNGYSESEIYMINSNAGNYVMSPDEEEIGAEVTPDDADVIEEASKNDKGIFEYEEDGEKWMLGYENIADYGLIIYICDTESEIYANVNSLTGIIMALCVGILVVSLAVVIIVTTIISKELEDITGVIHDVGTLDLTKTEHLDKYRGRKDEIGKIAEATITLTDAVKEAVENLIEKAVVLHEASDLMKDNTNKTATSVGHINGAASELADTASSTAENITDISMQMQNVQETMQLSMDSTATLTDASQQIRSTVDTGLDNVEQLKDISAQSMEAFNTIFEGIDNINTSSMKISEASEMIKSIAGQTNLLSLNASIEAARAGEAGRGFAVVADEIRNLSDQSQASAETINQMLEELQRNTKNAVEQSEKVKEFVHRQQASVAETADSFTGIANNISSVNDAIDGLVEANKRLEDGVRSISDSVTNLSAISEENAATAQELSATTESVNSNVEDLDEKGTGVKNAADELRQIVGVFKTE